MKHLANLVTPVLLLAALLGTPLMALAADSAPASEKGATGVIIIGDQTVLGVRATAHLKDVKAAMAKVERSETHHFAVTFQDADGQAVTTGTVTMKIRTPDGRAGNPVALPGMEEHFGVDISLVDKGTYRFKVGSKLPDGVMRQYEFEYIVN